MYNLFYCTKIYIHFQIAMDLSISVLQKSAKVHFSRFDKFIHSKSIIYICTILHKSRPNRECRVQNMF